MSSTKTLYVASLSYTRSRTVADLANPFALSFVRLGFPSYAQLVANIDITTAASDWLWAVFAVMLVSAIGLFGLSFTRPMGERAFHELAAAICFTASIACEFASLFRLRSTFGELRN